MTGPQKLPGANTTAQWYQDNYPGAGMDANCGVIHTTEGTDWPGYEGGATAPNATAKPNFAKKRLDYRQHFPVDRSSRALKNLAGGVETNTANVFQFELVGTCDPTHRDHWGKLRAGTDYLFWPEAPGWALESLGEMLAWLERTAGIPATSPVQGRWTPYPASYGPGGQRFTNTQWRTLRGWCGHQHVPENVHGDPGSLDFPAIAAAAKAILHPSSAVKPPAVNPPTKPTPAPTPQEADAMLLLYRTPKVTTAYEVSGASLIAVTKARADAVRAAGVKVEIVTVPDNDALWKLPKA